MSEIYPTKGERYLRTDIFNLRQMLEMDLIGLFRYIKKNVEDKELIEHSFYWADTKYRLLKDEIELYNFYYVRVPKNVDIDQKKRNIEIYKGLRDDFEKMINNNNNKK